jgi:apolipoprotein N-acyltransferase
MAKKTSLPSYALFIASALLLSGGWLMASFPIFIFLAFAPLFSLTDRATDTTSVWEKMEWVLLALMVGFAAAHSFDGTYIVSSMLYAILFTIAFIGHVWVRQTLGSRAGKITIIFFWLAIEYVLLKIRPSESTFLADSIRLQTDWVRWNVHTGYLGSTLWILMTNLMVYETFLSEKPFQWYWITLAVLFLLGPMAFSYTLDNAPIDKAMMLSLYEGNPGMQDVTYLARGEFMVRTSAWLSTLILLFTFVKSQTTSR